VGKKRVETCGTGGRRGGVGRLGGALVALRCGAECTRKG
jgi:hypothetical protein